MFNKKNKDNATTKESQSTINEKLVREVKDLRTTVERLDAQLFSMKNPNGRLDISNPYFVFSHNRYITFNYSDGSKIHNINIPAASRYFGSYKIKIDNNKGYIGLNYSDDETNDANYYIVDLITELVMEVDESTLYSLNSIEWIKS